MRKVRNAVIFIAIIALFTGCYSVRRKFIRKKESEEPHPVYVDFKEYPKERPNNLYDNYYLFAEAWMDEIINGLSGSYNYKRQRYAFNEIIRNLKKMDDIFAKEGRDKLKPIYNEIVNLSKKVSPNMTNIDRIFILRRMEAIEMKFSEGFKHSRVSQWIRKN